MFFKKSVRDLMEFSAYLIVYLELRGDTFI